MTRHGIALVVVSALAVMSGCGGDKAGGPTLQFVAKAAVPATVDLGARGKTAGDVYVFDVALLDENETHEVGHVYGTQTSIAIEGDEEVVQAILTFDLRDGNSLTVGGIGRYPRADVGLIPGNEQVRPILGGTGIYADATGTLTTVRRPDGRYEQTFRLDG